MTNQYLVSTIHEPIIAAAPTSTGNTVLVAGIFTIIGATIPLIYQVIFVHNENRRHDHESGINAVADLIAAARGILLARRIPTASNDADTKKTISEALSRFDSAYARLVLISPGLEEKLTPLRDNLLLIVKSDIGDASLDPRIESQLSDVLDYVRTTGLTFPMFKWLQRFKKLAGVLRFK